MTLHQIFDPNPIAEPTLRRSDPWPALDAAEVIAHWGRSPVSPFLAEPGNRLVRVSNAAAAGYRRIRHWAVLPTDIAAAPGVERAALDRLLHYLDACELRPIFAAVADETPYRDRDMYTMPIADDAHLDLADFTLAGKRRSSIRHSVTSARRASMTVVPYAPSRRAELEEISTQWLAQKRGGELGFTLGRFDPDVIAHSDWRIALDADNRAVGFVTWRSFDDGHGRVLDMMRRRHDAPNPTMDLLIAESLIDFAAAGIATASLGAVPRSFGAWSERVYPTRTLQRYKDKFAPEWRALHLVVPSRRALPGGLRALAHAYCPGALLRAVRRNA